MTELLGRRDESISDIARVNREVAEFLAKSNIKPGIYQGDDAKNLNNQIFQFLQKINWKKKLRNTMTVYYSMLIAKWNSLKDEEKKIGFKQD